jgi:succinoglycan biosynthesis protein ExoL
VRITYFAHDLTDAAVAKRVQMLRTAGADLRLAGFYRGEQPLTQVCGIEAVTLGQTFDRRLAARAGLVLRRSFDVRRLRPLVAGADLILARNLEMCVIAQAARIAAGSQGKLVYECLDIHTSMQGNDVPARVLRGIERQILRQSTALVLSSPAYISEYYRRFFAADLPRIILSENKRFAPDAVRPALRPRSGPPWRIGWFAKCQCEWSFHLLRDLARRLPGLVDIEIRGRPAAPVMRLIKQYLPLLNMRFEGPYTQAQLSTIYGGMHFVWSIDLNGGEQSYWLLPNRLYEGSFYNVPAIAAPGTEISRWLQRRRAGLVLGSWLARETTPEPGQATQWLANYLSVLNQETYDQFAEATAAIHDADLVWSEADCHRFLFDISN